MNLIRELDRSEGERLKLATERLQREEEELSLTRLRQRQESEEQEREFRIREEFERRRARAEADEASSTQASAGDSQPNSAVEEASNNTEETPAPADVSGGGEDSNQLTTSECTFSFLTAELKTALKNYVTTNLAF